MRANIGKILIISIIILFFASFFVFDLGQYLNLEYIKSQKDSLLQYKQNHPVISSVIFFVSYVITTSLSLPGAGLLSLLAGALFGLLWGGVLVSFASTIGATIAFLFSRYILKDLVQKKFGEYLEPINKGIEKEGAFYLFSIRLVFAFPFFIVNLLMGLTPIKLFTYVWVSQVGMLAATFLFVNAGTQLGSIQSASDILSTEIIISFALLGIFPLIAKKALTYIKEKYYVKETV